MQTLIVVESWFGNTRQIADALNEALSALGHHVDQCSATEAPDEIPSEIDLLIIGAPTHSRGLSRTNTRRQTGASDAERGVREWLSSLTFSEQLRIAFFTTVTSTSWFAGSAAKEGRKLLARRYRQSDLPLEHFLVEGMKGPLRRGESERAAQWAAGLV